MGVQLLNSYEEGPVLLAAIEEKLGPTVGERFARLGVTRSDFHVCDAATVDDLVAEVEETRSHVLLVDSVTASTLLAQDLRALVQGTPLRALFATVQVTKAGLAAGSNALIHEADLVLDVAGGVWSVRKSRYQEAGVAGELELAGEPRPPLRLV